MAESDLSISQMTAGQTQTGSIFPGINPDQNSASGYSNFGFAASDMASAFLQFLFPLNLKTNNKSVFGAINELEGTTLTGTLTAGQTTLTLQDAAITTTADYDFYTDKYGVAPTAVTVTDGEMILTFDAQAEDLSVKVVIH